MARLDSINSSRQIKSDLQKVPAEEWAQRWIPNIIDQRRFIEKCNEEGYTEFDVKTFYDLIDKYGFKSDGSSGYMYIKSARYVATDPESGEVLGSADTYEEAVNEWGEDVTITDSEAAEGQEETEDGLFQSRKPIKSAFPGENSRDEYLRMQGRNMHENQATLTQGEFDNAMDNNGYFIRGFYKWSPDSHNWGCEVDVNLYLVVSYAIDGGGVHIYLIDTSSGKKEMVDERYVQSLDYDDVAEECIDIGELIGENFTEFF